MAHRPIYVWRGDDYSRGDTPINQPAKIQAAFEDVLHGAGVDLFLCGHTHMYQRSFPVYNGTTAARNYTRPRAMVTLVAGAAGSVEGLTKYNGTASGRPTWHAFGYSGAEGFGLLDVTRDAVRWQYFAAPANGTAVPAVIDDITITK